VIDDSRKMGKGEPLHIVLGKKFKLEVWEAIIQKMALQEVAQFRVDKSVSVFGGREGLKCVKRLLQLVMEYPFVSKTLRDMHKPENERKHTHSCAMTLQSEGVGYDDLNILLRQPQDLEFTMGEFLKLSFPCLIINFVTFTLFTLLMCLFDTTALVCALKPIFRGCKSGTT